MPSYLFSETLLPLLVIAAIGAYVSYARTKAGKSAASTVLVTVGGLAVVATFLVVLPLAFFLLVFATAGV